MTISNKIQEDGQFVSSFRVFEIELFNQMNTYSFKRCTYNNYIKKTSSLCVQFCPEF